MTAASDELLATKRRELLSLDTQKKALQSEAEAIVSELTSELPDGGPPIGIDSPLVDADGYPRADIDVYRARTLRKRFKEIQTDHKALEKQIDAGLVGIAALTKRSGGNKQSTNNSSDMDEEEKKKRVAPKPSPKFDSKSGKWVVKAWDGSVAGVENGENRSFEDLNAPARTPGNAAGATVPSAQNTGTVPTGGNSIQQLQISNQQQQSQQSHVSFQEATIPFAIIDEVSPNSPASEAGIKENDILLQFGHVNSTNHRDFRAIAELLPLAASENKSISVAVRRKTTALGGVVEVIKTERMELKPRTWAGRGLLGCHIKPYTE